VSDAAETFAHAFSFGITLAAMTNVAQFVWWKCKDRRGKHAYKYGPCYLCVVAIPFVLAPPLHSVLTDGLIWTPPWITNGVYMAFTYIGFVLLLTGSLWSANLVAKIRKAWRDMQRSSKKSQLSVQKV